MYDTQEDKVECTDPPGTQRLSQNYSGSTQQPAFLSATCQRPPTINNSGGVYKAYRDSELDINSTSGYQTSVAGLRGWNDLPEVLAASHNIGDALNATSNSAELNVDSNALLESLNRAISSTSAALDVKPGTPDARMFESISSRIKNFGERLMAGSISSPVLGSVSSFVSVFEARDYKEAEKLITKLMKSTFSSENGWIISLKWLLNAAKKIPQDAL